MSHDEIASQGKIELHEADEYHKMFYDRHLWRVKFLGVELCKNPLDLWIYQEILMTCRPSVIIETGSLHGGSALFLACMLDLTGAAETVKVISIDCEKNDARPSHARIEFIEGNSVDLDLAHRVASEVDFSAGMVILDSNHRASHVVREMRIWEPLVGVGQYMIVEDSNICGHPVLPGVYGRDGGPWQAIAEFVSTRNDFVRDENCERFGITQNPCGYLKRVAAAETTETAV